MRIGMIDMQAMRKRWDTVGSKLDERGQRVFASGEVRAAGWGGLEAVHEITGLARSTIGRGLKDLDAAPLPKGRVRRKGGGRRHLSFGDGTLIEDLRRLWRVGRSGSAAGSGSSGNRGAARARGMAKRAVNASVSPFDGEAIPELPPQLSAVSPSLKCHRALRCKVWEGGEGFRPASQETCLNEVTPSGVRGARSGRASAVVTDPVVTRTEAAMANFGTILSNKEYSRARIAKTAVLGVVGPRPPLKFWPAVSTAAIVIASAGSERADDIMVTKAPAIPYSGPAAYNWNGLYAGGHLGAAHFADGERRFHAMVSAHFV